MNDDEKVGHYIEIWKQTVTVQQHFNDIEWRIRGLALTAATFALGAAAIAAKDGNSFVAGGFSGSACCSGTPSTSWTGTGTTRC